MVFVAVVAMAVGRVNVVIAWVAVVVTATVLVTVAVTVTRCTSVGTVAFCSRQVYEDGVGDVAHQLQLGHQPAVVLHLI